MKKRTEIACQGCGVMIPLAEAGPHYLCKPCESHSNKRAGAMAPSKPDNPASGLASASTTVGARVPAHAVGSELPSLDPLPLDELERQMDKVRAEGPLTSEDVTISTCEGCGSQVEVLNHLALGDCLFCGRKVTTGKPRYSYRISNEIVVPFALDLNIALRKCEQHLEANEGSYAKTDTIEHLSKETLRQVFVPFWAFDTSVKTLWDGMIDYWEEPSGLKGLVGKGGRWSKQPAHGERNHRYTDWVVCSSRGIPDDLIAEIAPFDLKRGVCFRGEHQQKSIPTEICAIRAREAWSTAQTGIRKKEYEASVDDAFLHITLPDEESIRLNGKVDFAEPKARLAVLPLYIYQRNSSSGQTLILVNGETGEVASRFPKSKWKERRSNFLIYGILALILGIPAFFFAPVLLFFAPFYLLYMRRMHNKKQKRLQAKRGREEATFLDTGGR